MINLLQPPLVLQPLLLRPLLVHQSLVQFSTLLLCQWTVHGAILVTVGLVDFLPVFLHLGSSLDVKLQPIEQLVFILRLHSRRFLFLDEPQAVFSRLTFEDVELHSLGEFGILFGDCHLAVGFKEEVLEVSSTFLLRILVGGYFLSRLRGRFELREGRGEFAEICGFSWGLHSHLHLFNDYFVEASYVFLRFVLSGL